MGRQNLFHIYIRFTYLEVSIEINAIGWEVAEILDQCRVEHQVDLTNFCNLIFFG